ncbi:MAG TPA: hypothetical protein VK528_12685 [Flavobacterium sp.]|nr:hypothetical protein [Flavobacterium sp.]
MRSFLLSILLATFCLGCKEESADAKVGNTDFKVAIDVIVEKDDSFALYYTTDGTIDFFSRPAIWQELKGSDQQQRIEFVIPGKIIPTQLRFDLGLKPDQPDVYFKRIAMEYNGRSFSAAGMDVFKYVQPDKHQCLADFSTGKITANIKDGKRLTPAIYPNQDALSKEIEKLTKP